jgi:hypothetical protein
MSETNVLLALIGAGLLSVVGFLIVGIAQMGLAQIATAENTGQMLDIMRKKDQLASQDSPVTVKAGTVSDIFFKDHSSKWWSLAKRYAPRATVIVETRCQAAPPLVAVVIAIKGGLADV